MNRKVQLTVPMIPEMELTIAKTAAAVAEFVKMDQDEIDELSFAIVEAYINSLEHSDSEHELFHVVFEMHPDELRVTMRDFGKGFEPEQARQRIRENARDGGMQKRGWGLRLMQHFTDDVDISSSSQGTTITMVKKVKPGRRE